MKSEINYTVVNNPDNYGKFYVDNVDQIFNYARTVEGVKSDVFIVDFEKELDKIRFSSIFSDFSNIYPVGLGQHGGNLLVKHKQTVTLNEKILNAVIAKNQKPVVQAGFAVRDSKELSRFLRKIEPLIQSERALVHNSRLIIGLTNEKGPNENGRMWQTWDVEPNSPVGNWLAIENAERQNSIPIDFNPNSVADNSEMFDLTIPYLKGIPFAELDRVISDNHDLLSSFRVKLKEVLDTSKKEGKNIEEIKNDIIRPQVDLLNRKFKSISNIRNLKNVGTAFSSITLGLLSFSTMGLGAVVSGFLGSSGLGLLVKNEVDYKKEIAKLEDNPLYLMWKLKSVK